MVCFRAREVERLRLGCGRAFSKGVGWKGTVRGGEVVGLGALWLGLCLG